MPTSNIDLDNRLFQIAIELVNQTSRNIFLTGKAGTGKTTFLKYIKENCVKQLAVVAPTGVAAINAGGVTMHSFFQLPFSPFIPGDGGFNKHVDEIANRSSLLGRLRMTTEKKKVIQELELLVIDEISMVRCDMLDAADTIMRHLRRRYHEPFGGVQVLFIGDMFQLPPVIKDAEWSLLKEFYNSPYFFDSHVIKETPPVSIEFDKIYRQSEEVFISILNQVRNNELDGESRDLLEKSYNPSFQHNKEDGYITLTTHNEKARMKNETELSKLRVPVFNYKAEKKGEFPDTAYPADLQLQLKVGAQVMFIKNDSEKIRRYYNGKIGIVTELDDEKIVVRCNDEPDEIEVGKETWENIRYSVDKSTRKLNEEVLGSFTQYPLRLAWAITIHKSQGLTFEKVIIDAGEAFAPGQVYVALSRCTTLDGIVLQSRLKPAGLFTDERIVRFSNNNLSANKLTGELEDAKKIYQLKTIQSLFDFKKTISEAGDTKKYVSENLSSFNEEAVSWIEIVYDKINTLQTTGKKFQEQIELLFQQNDKAAENEKLIERLVAGAKYFSDELSKIIEHLKTTPVVTDSRQHAKEINDQIKEIFIQLSLRQFLLAGFSGKFEMENFHRRKKSFVVPSFTINAYAGVAKERVDSPHPILHQQLRKHRDAICSIADLPIYIVAGSTTLDEMARYLPQDLTELKAISGFGDAKIEKYGQKFLDIILEYTRERNLSSLIHEKAPKRERKSNSDEKKIKTDTKAESFKLYREGKSVSEIATQRGLTQQTIEGHLAYFVFTGEVEISELVSPQKIALIEPLLNEFNGGSITPIKQKLGSDISFGEIRLVMAWVDFKKNQRPI
jgi:hypothetical protein